MFQPGLKDEYVTTKVASTISHMRSAATSSYSTKNLRTHRHPELLFFDRIFPYLDLSQTCWKWTRSVRGGNQESHKGGKAKYGQVRIDGQLCYTHRVTYECWYGPIPDGFVIDHLCGEARCCNPAHLSAMSLEENSRRAADITNGYDREEDYEDPF
jgi:hypothetical protein